MTVQNATCPPESLVSDFGLGKLDAASAETVSQHLETCDDCRQRVASLSGDNFVGRLRQAGGAAQPAPRRDRTYVPGESIASMANSTDGSSAKEDGLPRPSGKSNDEERQDGLGSPSSLSAPPELVNHPDFELIKELGQGGMGTVYLAKNRMMDRPEVLKVISKALLDRPGALERFQQEIRSAAKLAHPNIVAAYSVLRPGDLLVFAMEYVKGQDLSEVVKARGYLPVANAAFYIHQVALGLQHAHEKGMVHRDIKPNNLMLAIEGKKHVVKILDFGLAKATSEKAGETGLTKSGQMLGTPDYVAPEQTLAAHKADIRADIYSLGCTLYFLLSGGPPFQEQSLYAILEAHHKRDPTPLNLLRPEVPVELATIVGKMMAKDPAKRYQTPIEVARALVPFFKPGQSVVMPPSHTVQAQPAETAHGLAVATPPSPVTPPPTPFPTPVTPLPVAVAVPLPAAEPVRQFSVSIDTHRPSLTRRVGGWYSLPPWQRWGLAIGPAALLLILGVVFLLQTKDGAIRVEINDPQIEVAVKGTDFILKQADNGRDIKVSAGEKTLVVERGDFKFETDTLILKKGETITVEVTLLAGQIEVRQGDKLIGHGKLPKTSAQGGSDGFVPLFNGKDLTGWKTHPGRQGLWRVEKGVLIGAGPAASSLFSERDDFKNFHLRAEVRINEGGDSGIYCRTSFSALPWQLNGYEAQIKCGEDGDAMTGSLIGPAEALVKVSKSPASAGQWFILEITAMSARLIVKVNGQTTADYPAALGFSIGHIALQQHDPQTVVEFRKIEIKESEIAGGAKPANLAASTAKRFACQFDKRDRDDWSIDGDELVQNSAKRSPSLVFGEPKWGDYDFSVDFKKMAGNGVFTLGIGHGSANESFIYRLGLFTNTRHDVGYERRGKHFNLGFQKGSLNQGRWYGALVRVRGNKCECFLDGKKLFAFTADGAIKGPMSLSSKNTLYRFRNIVIKAPDGEVLLEGLPDLEHAGAPPAVPADANTNTTDADAFFADNAKKDGVKTLPSGLQYKALKTGDGQSPKATDTVKLHYRGTFSNGEEFDNSSRRGSAASFPLDGNIIKGWKEALPLMKVGDKWQLFVPPHLAYGEKGVRDKSGNEIIPPNAILIFEIELLGVE